MAETNFYEGNSALEDNPYTEGILQPDGTEYEPDTDSEEYEDDGVDIVDDDDEYEEESEDYDDDYDDEDEDEYETDDDDEEDYDDDYDDGQGELESLIIDGQEYSIEEIMEWQKGNMRQADYTRKTQELARQREELKELEQLRNYLQQNPHLMQSIQNGYPVNDPNLQSMVGSRQSDMNRDLFYEVKSMQIDRELERLEAKYGEIDQVALFNKATELQTEDLESVYKAIAYDNIANMYYEEPDYQSIYDQAASDIMKELEKNKNAVRTTVSSRQGKGQTQRKQISSKEASIAEALGISPSEYAKWKR